MNIPATKKALRFYRIMAWVVGVLLVILVLVGMPLKYIWPDVWLFNQPLGDRIVTYTGVPHGWLYLILLISAFNLKYKADWAWGWFIKIALAGTVPFLSFIAEHFATKDVQARIATAEQKQARRKQRRAERAEATVESSDEQPV